MSNDGIDWPAVFDAEADETTFMEGRIPGHNYISTNFLLKRPGSADDGQTARFICKVFDDDGCEAGQVEVDGEVWPVYESPKGRVQVKLLVARDDKRIKDLWIQRFKIKTSGEREAGSVLHLDGSDAQALAGLFQSLQYMPIEGSSTVRIDDDLMRRVLEDPSLLARYKVAPDVLKTVIEQDPTATDIVAVAGRRSAVDRFRRLLNDESYFKAEKSRLGLHGSEAIWQRLFEEHPWILGAGLTQQLLTSWDSERLEQVVAGYSVAGSGKRADALLRTGGIIRSMVFAEIKTAKTPLLMGKEYRPGAWSPSKELGGGVSQVHATIHAATTQIGNRLVSVDDDGAEIPGEWTYLYQPRSFLIIGSLSEFVGKRGGHKVDKMRSFELYRRQLVSPEIVTFDELLARAEWIANMSADDTCADKETKDVDGSCDA